MGLRRRRANLEESLRLIEDHYQRDDHRGARAELRRAKKAFPEEQELEDWEGLLLIAEERYAEALRFLEGILARDPENSFALRERASTLIELGRFSEGLEALRDLLSREIVEEDPEELAGVRHEMALCLDRLGKCREADEEFRKAALLDPEGAPRPPRLSEGEFDALVGEALRSIPEYFQPYLRQTTIVVQDYPAPEEDDPFLLGLYVGVPRTDRFAGDDDPRDQIFIYKRNHEISTPSPGELEEEVRRTVIHEIAHHFGLDEDEMGTYA